MHFLFQLSWPQDCNAPSWPTLTHYPAASATQIQIANSSPEYDDHTVRNLVVQFREARYSMQVQTGT